MSMIDQLKAAFTAAGEEMIDGDAGTDKTLEFAYLAHHMMPGMFKLITAVDVVVDPDGDLRTMDLSGVVSAIQELKGEA